MNDKKSMFTVKKDGSGDHPLSNINAASGDTILVHDGTFMRILIRGKGYLRAQWS